MPICPTCNEPIVGKCLQAGNKSYHPDHFVCNGCQIALSGQVYQVDDVHVCGACYQKQFSVPCARCDQPIRGQSIRALDRKWHPDCFCCSICKKPLYGERFAERKGVPLCVGCSTKPLPQPGERKLPPARRPLPQPSSTSAIGNVGGTPALRPTGGSNSRRAAPTRPKSAQYVPDNVSQQLQSQGMLSQGSINLPSMQPKPTNPPLPRKIQKPPLPEKPKIPIVPMHDVQVRPDNKHSPRPKSMSLIQGLPVPSKPTGDTLTDQIPPQNLGSVAIMDLMNHLPWFKAQWQKETEENRQKIILMLDEDLKRGVASKEPTIQVKAWTKAFSNLNSTFSEPDIARFKSVVVPLSQGINNLLKQVRDASNLSNTALIQRLSSNISQTTKRIFMSIAELIKVLGDNIPTEVLTTFVQNTAKNISNMSVEAEPNKDIVNAAKEALRLSGIINLVVDNLRNSTEEISSTSSQLLSTIEIQQFEEGTLFHSVIIQLLAESHNLVDLCRDLLQGVVTLLALMDMKNSPKFSIEKQQEIDSARDENIWDCKANSDQWPEKSGTLNTLVLTLTSPDSFSVPFQKTFITTFRSFTTPEKLFTKLQQRFMPSKHVASADMKQIQIRICIVLKYWFETRIGDFDDELTKELYLFLRSIVARDHKDLSVMLINALDTARAKEDTRFTLSLVQTKQYPISPLQVFQNTSAREIAEQLTIISSSIYQATNINELLNLSWSKPKTRHNSPHVMASIRRFNQFSFWVPTVILGFESLRERSNAMNKFIEIAKELRNLQNFDGIMGVVAGMTVSSVDRLKFSKLTITDAMMDTWNQLVECMAPDHSWKIYREQLHNCSPPAVPYLGTYLTDLTFIEDGNPDCFTVDENEVLINFRKRELLYKVLQEIQVYQTSRYNIEPKEPLLTYLRYLPNLDDEILYSLSLLREPRGASMKDLVT